MKRQDKVKMLIKRLSHKKEAVRSSAAIALGNLRARAAVSTLVATLRDESREVRKWVGLALIAIGDKNAMTPLMEQLDDPDETVRCWSAAVVRKLSGEGFGFEDNATFEEIEEAIPRIKSWWKGRRGSLRKRS